MSEEFANRTYVVTGAARGIGLAVVKRLLKEGALSNLPFLDIPF